MSAILRFWVKLVPVIRRPTSQKPFQICLADRGLGVPYMQLTLQVPMGINLRGTGDIRQLYSDLDATSLMVRRLTFISSNPRIYLEHLGFLTIENLKLTPLTSWPAAVVLSLIHRRILVSYAAKASCRKTYCVIRCMCGTLRRGSKSRHRLVEISICGTVNAAFIIYGWMDFHVGSDLAPTQCMNCDLS
ncbi:Uncharacterized protein Y057_095 [Fusarium fujikuroi]|nr:Uncharacterized protein Y057_095 [Fusarium fujikuroi]